MDSFGRIHTYLRISVTEECNLRCIYCVPTNRKCLSGDDDVLTFSEIERISLMASKMGITKIRFTGGEPLLRKDLPVLVSAVSKVPGIKSIGLTTNGLLLSSFVNDLKSAGLTHLNISLDTLKPERFIKITQSARFADVMAGIDAGLIAGFVPLKINVVVMKGVNDDEFFDFVEMTRTRPINVRFIEFMPFQNNSWTGMEFLSYREMIESIRKQFKLVPVIPEQKTSTFAKEYRIEGFIGRISFITSMSDSFCGSCNRLRLLSDGSLKSCLFQPAFINLRSFLRAGDDKAIEESIRSAIAAKPAAHPSVEKLVQIENRSMIEIGG